jgi:hypothetical protein
VSPDTTGVTAAAPDNDHATDSDDEISTVASSDEEDEVEVDADGEADTDGEAEAVGEAVAVVSVSKLSDRDLAAVPFPDPNDTENAFARSVHRPVDDHTKPV